MKEFLQTGAIITFMAFIVTFFIGLGFMSAYKILEWMFT